MLVVLFKSLRFGMKFHMWIAKWFLSTQIRPISYYWTDSLEYVLCPRTFPTTLVFITNIPRYFLDFALYVYLESKSITTFLEIE